MENITPINRSDFRQGYYIELECSFCRHTEMFAADSETELMMLLEQSDWKNIDSDAYGLTGHYCGCDYMDEEEE